MGYKPGCYTCQRMAREEAPIWDRIYRTHLWTVVHSYNSALLGWLVLIPNSHIDAVAEMTDEESIELGRLQRLVSQALHEIKGCVKTYIAQFAEHPLHTHVHFHVIARYTDQPDCLRGPRIFDALGVSEDQRVTEDQMNAFAIKVHAFLTSKNTPGVL